MPEENEGVHQHEEERMLVDAILPDEIRPPSTATCDQAKVAFVTGGCGFLGRHVVLQLLLQTDMHLVCLVRDKASESAADRVVRVFSSMGISRTMLDTRVEVVVGDLTEPEFGLVTEDYAELSGKVDNIYHCAALVDWVRGYRHLYRMNVGGVLALIRFACHEQTKRLLFVSSIAVCYAAGAPERIDEDTDMLPYISGMPLGYARSKCVAEALLRQAAARGVPVTVLRPALIAGDSQTGISNPTDLIAALVQGCVATGMAIDADWLLDCVPVDFVARVMVDIPQGDTNSRVLNLLHPRPRHWREFILWMNLHGYSVKLVSSDTWIRHLFEEQAAHGTMLYAQRQFFRGRPQRSEETRCIKPYEAYLAESQAHICSHRTHELLDGLGLREPLLEAGLLHAYFDYYKKVGVVSPCPSVVPQALTLDELLGRYWTCTNGIGINHDWSAAERSPIGCYDGLLKEIAGARIKDGAGVWRLRLDERRPTDRGQPVNAVLKVKAVDQMVQDLSAIMASLCRPSLGRYFEQYRDAFGLAQSHTRELALYQLQHPSLVRHRPACYGIFSDTDRERWAMLIEYLPEADNGGDRPHLRANEVDMKYVLNGMAEIHAIWYENNEVLNQESWLKAPPGATQMCEMTALWVELADFASDSFETWCGPDIRTLQAEVIGDLENWWPRMLRLPSTLIHNDFNPRNFVVRETMASVACVSTIGNWQRLGFHNTIWLSCSVIRGTMT